MIDATPRPPRRSHHQQPQQQPQMYSSYSPRAESNSMSHQDIVRHPATRGPAGAPYAQQSADDVWMQQQALAVAGGPQPSMLAHGGGGGNDVQPLQMVHRSLRGRYKLAVLLAAVGAAVGCAVGWTQNEKVFRAKGVIRVDPQRTLLSGVQENQAEFPRFMTSEASSIKSPEFVRRVMQRPEWKNAVPAAWPEELFLLRLTAAYANSGFDINVSFDHPNDATAKAAVAATLKAYEEYRSEQRTIYADQGVEYWQKEYERIQKSIADAKAQILEIQRRDAGGNIDSALTIYSERLAKFQASVEDAKFALRRMKSMQEAAKTNPPRYTPEQLALSEPQLARLLLDRGTAQAELTRIERQYGVNAPIVRNAREQLENYDIKIQQITDAIGASIFGIIPATDPQSPPVFVTAQEIASREVELKDLEQNLKDVSDRVGSWSEVRYAMGKYQNDIDANQDLLKDRAAKLADAQARALTLNANVRTFSNPLIDVAEDKRPTMATLGFVAGGALPLLGLTLYGLFDRKYRYSDETVASGSTRGVPLLGILPNLPDRLSDPSQASVAAHCVHQIRTMLQLNVLGEGPAVISVTSATSGDGKTSLSLALGLSFAASGSRTLLIDTDLIGAGLSARLGIREPQGVGEAILSRDPMSYVRETDVNGLSVLPVGTEGGQNASAFSPSAVRRLIADVREHFDIVLIDTGPVLGSIEATPVVAASDAVILTVARGQNRDLVEKAIGHLRAIGSRIAGVVFNRANARDFERSISGISLRSVSRASSFNGTGPTNGHPSSAPRQDKRLGPLVHSVRGTREETN